MGKNKKNKKKEEAAAAANATVSTGPVMAA